MSRVGVVPPQEYQELTGILGMNAGYLRGFGSPSVLDLYGNRKKGSRVMSFTPQGRMKAVKGAGHGHRELLK